MANPAWRAGTAGQVSGTSFSVSVPTGLQAGDLVVVWIDSANGVATLGAPDASWTQLFANSSGISGAKTAAWSHKATSADTTAGSWTFTSTSSLAAARYVCDAYSGADVDGTPIAAVTNGRTTSNSASVTLGAVTPGVANCTLVGQAIQNTSSGAITVDAAMTQQIQSNIGTNQVGVGTQAITGTGSTGTRTFTNSVSNAWSWMMFAIAPAPPAPVNADVAASAALQQTATKDVAASANLQPPSGKQDVATSAALQQVATNDVAASARFSQAVVGDVIAGARFSQLRSTSVTASAALSHDRNADVTSAATISTQGTASFTASMRASMLAAKDVVANAITGLLHATSVVASAALERMQTVDVAASTAIAKVVTADVAASTDISMAPHADIAASVDTVHITAADVSASMNASQVAVKDVAASGKLGQIRGGGIGGGDTGAHGASSVSDLGGAYPWTNPNNALLNDGSSATVTLTTSATSNVLRFVFPNLSIPAGVPIIGIEVDVVPQATSIFFNAHATIAGQTKLAGMGANPVVLGGSTDTWGGVWTAADFTAATVDVSIGAGTNGTVGIDYVSLRVYYGTQGDIPATAIIGNSATRSLSASARLASPALASVSGAVLLAQSGVKDVGGTAWLGKLVATDVAASARIANGATANVTGFAIISRSYRDIGAALLLALPPRRPLPGPPIAVGRVSQPPPAHGYATITPGARARVSQPPPAIGRTP